MPTWDDVLEVIEQEMDEGAGHAHMMRIIRQFPQYRDDIADFFVAWALFNLSVRCDAGPGDDSD